MINICDIIAPYLHDEVVIRCQALEKYYVSWEKTRIWHRDSSPKNLPPPDKLIALADYFGVTTDYLLGRSPYNINPSLLYEKLYENMTVGELVEILKMLSAKQKQAAATLIDDMRFRAEYRARAKLDGADGD